MDCGTVFRTPGRAARGLVEWALDLWPYVNGKALTQGLKIAEMDCSDMLDVIHFYFEEDNRYASGEEAEALSAMRTSLYEMYGDRYKYSIKSSRKTKKYSDNDNLDFPEPFDTKQVKPYMPPTEFNPNSSNPFGEVLEAPLG